MRVVTVCKYIRIGRFLLHRLSEDLLLYLFSIDTQTPSLTEYESEEVQSDGPLQSVPTFVFNLKYYVYYQGLHCINTCVCLPTSLRECVYSALCLPHSCLCCS